MLSARHEGHPRLRLHRQRHTREQHESSQLAAKCRCFREGDNRRDRGREWKSHRQLSLEVQASEQRGCTE